MAALIDLELLEDVRREFGDRKFFKLPEMPELENLSGKVMSVSRLIRLTYRALGLLKAASDDQCAAANELTMSRNKNLPTAVRLYHYGRFVELLQQAERRHLAAYAKIIGVSEAVVL